MALTAFHLRGDRRFPTYFQTLPLPRAQYLSTWVVTGAVASAASFASYVIWKVPALLGTFTLLGLSIAIVPSVMEGIYAIILFWTAYVPTFLQQHDGLRPEWESWVEAEFKGLNSSRIPAYLGIVLAPLAVVAYWLGQAFARMPLLPTLLSLAIIVGASFVCGVGLVAIFYLGRAIWDLGNLFAVRPSGPVYGALSTGGMLVKCYALAAIAWCVYTASATWSVRGRWIPLLTLAAPALVFFVGSFIVCQFPLHKRMVDCKRTALADLNDLLERLRPSAIGGITEDQKRQIDYCLSEVERVRKWPEWPFGLGNLSGILGASLGAIAPQLIGLALPLIQKRL